MLMGAWQKMKRGGGGGRKEIIFPLLKVLTRMKSVLHSDLLKFGRTRRGAGFVGKGIILYKETWKSKVDQIQEQIFPPGAQGPPGCVCLALEHKDIPKQGSSVRKSLIFYTWNFLVWDQVLNIVWYLWFGVFFQESG